MTPLENIEKWIGDRSGLNLGADSSRKALGALWHAAVKLDEAVQDHRMPDGTLTDIYAIIRGVVEDDS